MNSEITMYFTDVSMSGLYEDIKLMYERGQLSEEVVKAFLEKYTIGVIDE
jgi:hypothetical protein